MTKTTGECDDTQQDQGTNRPPTNNTYLTQKHRDYQLPPVTLWMILKYCSNLVLNSLWGNILATRSTNKSLWNTLRSWSDTNTNSNPTLHLFFQYLKKRSPLTSEPCHTPVPALPPVSSYGAHRAQSHVSRQTRGSFTHWNTHTHTGTLA